jgi:hypothetical protein
LQLHELLPTIVVLVGQARHAPLDCSTVLALHWQRLDAWLYMLPEGQMHEAALKFALAGQPAHDPPVRIT